MNDQPVDVPQEIKDYIDEKVKWLEKEIEEDQDAKWMMARGALLDAMCLILGRLLMKRVLSGQDVLQAIVAYESDLQNERQSQSPENQFALECGMGTMAKLREVLDVTARSLSHQTAPGSEAPHH